VEFPGLLRIRKTKAEKTDCGAKNKVAAYIHVMTLSASASMYGGIIRFWSFD
jgi:hypothetical protein